MLPCTSPVRLVQGRSYKAVVPGQPETRPFLCYAQAQVHARRMHVVSGSGSRRVHYIFLSIFRLFFCYVLSLIGQHKTVFFGAGIMYQSI